MKLFPHKWIPLTAILLGLAAAVVITVAALRHNIQCEFYCGGQVHYAYIVAIFASWIVMVSGPVLALYTFCCIGRAIAQKISGGAA